MKITGTLVAQVVVIIALIVSLITHIRGEGHWYFTTFLLIFLPLLFDNDSKSNNSEG